MTAYTNHGANGNGNTLSLFAMDDDAQAADNPSSRPLTDEIDAPPASRPLDCESEQVESESIPEGLPKWELDHGNPPGPRQLDKFNKAAAAFRWRGKSHVEITDHGRHEMTAFCGAHSDDCRRREWAIHSRFGGKVSRANFAAIVEAFDAARVALILPEIDKRSTEEERAERARLAAIREEEHRERQAKEAENKAAAQRLIPPGAKAVIISELNEDQSDMMTDYHGHKTLRQVVIGWRFTDRESFAALRKAAAEFPETAHLGPGRDRWSAFVAWDHDCDKRPADVFLIDDHNHYWKGSGVPKHFLPDGFLQNPDEQYGNRPCAVFPTEAELDAWIAERPAPAGTEWRKNCDSFEHRENYSMGAGNYLKDGSRDRDGWGVRSTYLGDVSRLDFSWLEQHEAEKRSAKSQPTSIGSTSPGSESGGIGGPFHGCEVQKHHHSKRGFDFWLVVLADRVDRSEYERLLNRCESLGGWYSRKWGRTPGGFAFREQSAAERFAREIGGNGGNDPSGPGAGPDGGSDGDGPHDGPQDGPDTNGHSAPGSGPVTALPGSRPVANGTSSATTAADDRRAAIASRFREMADGMQRTIDSKLDTSGNRLTNTPKRQAQASSARCDGENLQAAQFALRILADRWEAGTIPPELASITTKKQVEEMTARKLSDRNSGYYSYYTLSDEYRDNTPQAIALRALVAGGSTETEADRLEKKRQIEIDAAIAKLRFSKIDGFFPTPPAVVAEMIDRARLSPGLRVLEPSAGIGNIADAVRAEGCQVECCERIHTLAEVLELKGHATVTGDFLEKYSDDLVGCDPPRFDRVLMNPPFENAQDADHVRHAFAQLKPGGRLVAIMSAGTFSRSRRKEEDFREWLDCVGGRVDDLPAGSFEGKDAFRETGIACKIVVIDRD